jgi:hypothetical protein
MRRGESDAAHETAANRADVESFAGVCVRGRGRWLGLIRGLVSPLDFEQRANAGEVLASIAFGEKAVVPDAVEAVGQDVQQETADELVWGEAHDAGAPAATIVLVGERDFIVVDDHEPRIGDGGSMRVAGEIGEHALGSAERRLGVDDEGALTQRAHAFGERGGLGERGEFAEEAELAAAKGSRQPVQEEPTKCLRQSADGEQEVGLATDPSLAVEGDAAAGDETMDMRVYAARRIMRSRRRE